MTDLSSEQLLSHVGHRPFSLPNHEWLLYQEWRKVLFIHVRVPVDMVQQCIPSNLLPDMFNGSCWISFGVFNTAHSRFRGAALLPVSPAFRELNVRTYVVHNNKPGIYFIDIRSTNRVSAFLLRTFSALHYQHVAILNEEGNCYCRFKDQRAIELQIRYHTTWMTSRKSQLESWLTERYCCYTVEAGKLYSYDIHHLPWKLSRVEIDQATALYTVADWHVNEKDFSLVHYSSGQQVLLWRRQLLSKHIHPHAARERVLKGKHNGQHLN